MTAWNPQPPTAAPLAPPVTGTPMPYAAPAACFFDPAHGYAAEMVVWQPPRGVPRPIPVCSNCRQVLITEAGQQTTPRRERGDGGSDVAEIALGAVGGLAGGMVLGSMLGDDEPTDDDEDDDLF
ncbi:hypothetical protein [Amycolatopsis sp. NPDC021455]|uniref:hypothetical protein n=1 Tax=Amycolatopsis sp. NPDC021455 TaxID=3154901 RepID=UPI0033E9B797